MNPGKRAKPVKYLIRDRDTRLSTVFDAEGIQIRRELLDKILIRHDDHARRVPTEWLRHHAPGRPHHGLGP